MPQKTIKNELYELLKELFPICRSITGNGVRQTLEILSNKIPIEIHEVPSGTKVFDWIVPKEWNINDAYIRNENGDKIVDFKKNNLHVVSYSIPVDKRINLSTLQEHLYSLPEYPDAIPYVTSYYEEKWGFCISHNDRIKLKNEKYHVVIDSTIEDGSLTYASYVIKGQTEKEIFLSTYICHPSMANNELSGPVVTAFICEWLASQDRRYTYRIVFLPETIGSIAYLSKYSTELKQKVICGFNISCIGDEGGYSVVSSPYEDTYADRIANYILSNKYPIHKKYSYLDRGSDERQYCSPGIDLPLVSLCRSKYKEYYQYHTSLDDLNFVTDEGLYGGYSYVKDCLELIEKNYTFKKNFLCEPQLGRYNLYEKNVMGITRKTKKIKDFLAYCNGSNDILYIAQKIGCSAWDLFPIADQLRSHNIIEYSD